MGNRRITPQTLFEPALIAAKHCPFSRSSPSLARRPRRRNSLTFGAPWGILRAFIEIPDSDGTRGALPDFQ